jgi:hypothetical protein
MTQLGVERAGTPALLRIPVRAPQLDYGQQVKLVLRERPSGLGCVSGVVRSA